MARRLVDVNAKNLVSVGDRAVKLGFENLGL